MPLTFPSHAAAVLPLKVWRPRWFDGVALVVGSTAPDLPYVAVGILPHTPSAHNLLGVLIWCLPVSLPGCWLTRWAAPIVAAHLPSWGREYGVLAVVHHRWYITVASALLGSLSHVLWDGFTHEPGSMQGWATQRLSALSAEPVAGVPWWWLLQQTSTVSGGLAALGFALMIRRRGLLPAWHGNPVQTPVRPRLFWSVTLSTTAALVTLSLLLPAASLTNVLGVRLLVSAGLGLLAASATVQIFPPTRVAAAMKRND